MKLQRIENWAKAQFTEDSEPCLHRIRRLLRDGKLPGAKIGGHWYIDVDTFDPFAGQGDDETDEMVDSILEQLAS